MDSPETAALQLRTTLTECFEQMRFARAAELARSRRFLEAEALLAPKGRVSADLKTLDLLARISAQQGQYARARELWSAALEQAPGNAEYERAIECTREAELSQAAWQRGILIFLATLLLGSSCVSAWMYFRESSSHAKKQTEAKEPAKVTATPAPISAHPEAMPATPEPKSEPAPTE